MPFILMLLPMLLISFSSQADDHIELYIPNSPPLASLDISSQSIAILPIVEALRQIERNAILREIPWARAQKKVSAGQNKLIAPLARTQAREDQYIWIAPLLETNNVIFSLTKPAQSLSEAKSIYRRIGVGQGSAQAETLVEYGFKPQQIIHLKLGENPGRLLRLGRIDGWFTSVTEGNHIWHNLLNETKPLKSSPILSSTTLYLACSIDCDQNLIAKLRAIITPTAGPEQNQSIKNPPPAQTTPPLSASHTTTSYHSTRKHRSNREP